MREVWKFVNFQAFKDDCYDYLSVKRFELARLKFLCPENLQMRGGPLKNQIFDHFIGVEKFDM